MSSRSPSWGAWIEIRRLVARRSGSRVAPPRGERGLKYDDCDDTRELADVAPPRGERGLKSQTRERTHARPERRSPSWGAWIEISVSPFSRSFAAVAPPRGERGLKLGVANGIKQRVFVAPPRGERGLKYIFRRRRKNTVQSRSPSWGAWIEIYTFRLVYLLAVVAPPRGERGLKYIGKTALDMDDHVAPPRGERGLKCRLLHRSWCHRWSLPLVGSVD